MFPPPVDAATEFVGAPIDAEHERIDVGVAIVGGGPAGTACAIRLLELVKRDPQLEEQLGEVPVAIIEKARVAGAHQLSGAVMDPGPIRDLCSGEDSWPRYDTVTHERVHLLLSSRRALALAPTPPPFRNRGNVVVSVAELTRWLADRAEGIGATVLTETAAAKLLVRDGAVLGVRTGDKGRSRDGSPKRNFEPGSDVTAQATVLAEGCWGHLTGAAIGALGLGGTDPQVWALGVKEVWEVQEPLHEVIHTLGWPLRAAARYREFGGSWIYPMNRDGQTPRVSIGFVVGLDYADVRLSAHDLLQELKLHPLVEPILAGAKRIAWGAKAIPEGGYWAMPTMHAPGMVICGDGAGLVDVPRLKGVHMAIGSGMLAAQEIYAQLKAGSKDFAGYEYAVRGSQIGRDLYRSRNMRQPFHGGLVAGGAISGAMVLTGGRLPGGHWRLRRDADATLLKTDRHERYPKPDNRRTFDKLSSVFLSANETREDAPSHIRVARRVERDVAEMWQWMCPAGVYEVADDAPAEGPVDVIVKSANCVQCGAITAKGGRLMPPEGGDGPVYQVT